MRRDRPAQDGLAAVELRRKSSETVAGDWRRRLYVAGLRRGIWKSAVAWANFGPLARAYAARRPCREPPVLVVSLPRSGSSWAGEVLGLADDAAYLREPLTQVHLWTAQYWSPVFFEVQRHAVPASYRRAARSAFLGVPAFPRVIAPWPRQWGPADRARRRIVIKEVNPLALDWLLETYRPRTILLLRHPAAVATSYFRLGWTIQGPQFASRFSAETLRQRGWSEEAFGSSFWSRIGALQAVAQKHALAALAGRPDHRVVTYEDLCADPVGMFRELYDFAGLHWSERTEREVRIRSEAATEGAYATSRISAEMATRWHGETPMADLAALKAAYLHFEPRYYRADW